jgi:excisionase family DNA binding protein
MVSAREAPVSTLTSHLTLSQAARRVDCSTATLRQAIRDGRISAVKLPSMVGAYLIPVADVERFAADFAERHAARYGVAR